MYISPFIFYLLIGVLITLTFEIFIIRKDFEKFKAKVSNAVGMYLNKEHVTEIVIRPVKLPVRSPNELR